MWHELRHIEIGPKGITIRPQEVDDWKSILREYGIDWNEYGHEVPDIFTSEEDNLKEKNQKGNRERQNCK